MDEYALQIISVHSLIDEHNLTKPCLDFITRCGYEIIFNYQDDVANHFEEIICEKEYVQWYVILDLLPWHEKKERLTDVYWNDKQENYRTDWALYTVTCFLKEENATLSLQKDNQFFKVVGNSSYIQQVLQQYYPTIYKEVLHKVNLFKMPFKVIQYLYDFGCNNKTALVEYENKICICKLFKNNKLQYLENEVKAREALDGIVAFPPIILKQNNYILLEYIEHVSGISKLFNSFNLIRVKYIKQIFSDIKNIFNAGIINFDFHPGNVLITSDNEIVYLDFEYIYFHNNKCTFSNNPGFIAHAKTKYDSPLEHITYTKYWFPYIQISLEHMIKFPLGLLYGLRFITIIKLTVFKYKKKVYNRLNKMLKYA